MRDLVSSLLLAVGPAFVSPLHAQDVLAPGLRVEIDAPVPVLAQCGALADGRALVFDGVSVVVTDASLAPARELARLPTPVFASFVLPHPGGEWALIGESTHGDLYRIALEGELAPAPTLPPALARVPLNFAAAWEDETHAVLSAAQCFGSGCANEIVRLNVRDGSTSVVARVNGPSGPLAFTAEGLVYATQSWTFPAPAGVGDLLVWKREALLRGTLLTELDARVLASGIGALASLAVEPARGRLLAARSRVPGISEILEIDAFGRIRATLAKSAEWLGPLAFAAPTGVGRFAPFEPDGAPDLLLQKTKWAANHSHLVRVSTRRPELALDAPFPGAPGVLTITGGPPHGRVRVLGAPAGAWQEPERELRIGGLTFWTAFATGMFTVGPESALDAAGAGSVFWPGGGGQAVQVLALRADASAAGSSNVVFE